MSQTIKDKAVKKIQLALDKLIDALSFCPDSVVYKINEALDKVREAEGRAENEDADKFKRY